MAAALLDRRGFLPGDGIATELRHLADQVQPILEDEVGKMLEADSGADRPERVPATV